MASGEASLAQNLQRVETSMEEATFVTSEKEGALLGHTTQVSFQGFIRVGDSELR